MNHMMCYGMYIVVSVLIYQRCVDAAVTADLDLSNMPVSICGWPSLHTTGKFPEWNTRLAQYLLGYVLGESIPVDGIFTDSTTDQIERYQAQVGLEVNGYLNSETWPSLVGEVTPLLVGASGRPVEALQDTLTVNGYPLEISGIFDDVTEDALSRFQTDRGASKVDGKEVDEQSWHLLTTQCNSTLPGHYWFDAGWPQGNISKSTFQCLQDNHFEYAVIECWREKDNGSFVMECVDNIANARDAGFSFVDVYMYFERNRDPSEQAHELLNNLTWYDVEYKYIMLDVEGDKWNDYTTEENQAFMLELRAVFDEEQIPLTMYAGSNWESYFGSNFTAFQDVPLIYAHYDNIPSFYDYDYAPYGGWERASGKQFYDGIDPEILCGLPLDWDWSPSPFWSLQN